MSDTNRQTNVRILTASTTTGEIAVDAGGGAMSLTLRSSPLLRRNYIYYVAILDACMYTSTGLACMFFIGGVNGCLNVDFERVYPPSQRPYNSTPPLDHRFSGAPTWKASN